MLGPFKRLKYREGSRKNLALFLFILKKYRDLNFIGKIEWSMNSEPRRAGGSKEYLKKLFLFLNSTKK